MFYHVRHQASSATKLLSEGQSHYMFLFISMQVMESSLLQPSRFDFSFVGNFFVKIHSTKDEAIVTHIAVFREYRNLIKYCISWMEKKTLTL